MKNATVTKKAIQDITITLERNVFNELRRSNKSPELIINSEVKPTPFVKWVGGKRAIIKELLKYLPESFNNYYEPFVGGGALFYEIYDQKKNRGYNLSDLNQDLVITYNAVKDNPLQLIKLLKEHSNKHNEEYYYCMRSMFELHEPLEIAARFLYLNKTCFNGLWRVNKKGNFNVPIGRYTNPNITQEANILACSNTLKNASIEYKAFDKIKPKRGDLCYFDPPYDPTNDDSFTAYTKLNFDKSDQIKLKVFCDSLSKKGVHFMLSNSDTKFIREIYKSYNIHTVSAPRFINCKPGGRSPVNEVLVTNY